MTFFSHQLSMLGTSCSTCLLIKRLWVPIPPDDRLFSLYFLSVVFPTTGHSVRYESNHFPCKMDAQLNCLRQNKLKLTKWATTWMFAHKKLRQDLWETMINGCGSGLIFLSCQWEAIVRPFASIINLKAWRGKRWTIISGVEKILFLPPTVLIFKPSDAPGSRCKPNMK